MGSIEEERSLLEEGLTEVLPMNKFSIFSFDPFWITTLLSLLCLNEIFDVSIWVQSLSSLVLKDHQN